MIWRPLPPDASLPDVIDRLNRWLRDADRFQAALIQPRSMQSTSDSVSLNQQFKVDVTRVDGLLAGSTGSGTSLTIGGANSNIQFNEAGMLGGDPEFTWQTGTAHLGVSGSQNLTGGLTVGGLFNLAQSAVVGATLTASGNASVTGYLLVGATLTVDGNAGVTGYLLTGATLTVGGNAGVTGYLLVGNSLTVNTNVGVTGNVSVVGGLSVTAGSSFRNDCAFGIGGVTAMWMRTAGVFSPDFEPTVTLGAHLGRAARRWGNIFGGTINISNGIVTTVGSTHTLNGKILIVDLVTTGFIHVGTTFGVGSVSSDWIPEQNSTRKALGAFNSVNSMWGGLWLNRILGTTRGPDLTAGTTVTIGLSGNYYLMNGGATVAGLSSEADVNNNAIHPWGSGCLAFIRLGNSTTLTSNSNLLLAGGLSWHGWSADMIGLVAEGPATFREMFRTPSHRNLFSSYNSTVIGSTDVNTSMLGFGLGTTSLPANFLTQGMAIRATMRGVYTTDSPSGTAKFNFNINGTSVNTSQAITLPASQTNQNFEFDHLISVFSIGVGGGVFVGGAATFDDPSTPTGTVRISMPRDGTTSVDTTAVSSLDYRMEFGSASGGTLTVQQVLIEAIR